MDLDLRSLAICLVGWSMAVAGFLLSVTVSIITAVVPPLQHHVSEDAYEVLRRHIQISPGDEKSISNTPSPSAQHTVASDAASADSVHSLNSTDSEPSTCHRATSTPPTSLGNSPELPLRPLPQTSHILHGKSEQICTSTSRHVCTQRKCSNPASTSSAVQPPAPQENTEKRRTSSNGEGVKMKNTRAMRAVSWLKGSPLPLSSSPQSTPRSSSEYPRVPLSESPVRAATLHEFVHETPVKKVREPRRAKTLLPFKRHSQTSTRADAASASPPEFPDLTMTSMASPVSEGMRSEPNSPRHAGRELSDASSDVELSGRENKRRISYFARLKRRMSAKESGNVHEQGKDSRRDNTVASGRRSFEPSELNSGERGRLRDKGFTHGLCDKRRRPVTTSAGERPPRTNPYDAPYFFPTPASPDAVDYVKLAKTERKRTSTSPTRLAFGPDVALPPSQPQKQIQGQTQNGLKCIEQEKVESHV